MAEKLEPFGRLLQIGFLKTGANEMPAILEQRKKSCRENSVKYFTWTDGGRHCHRSSDVMKSTS